MLRPYQQEAHDAVIAWIKRTREPCCISAPTASGKSWIIAALAKTIHDMSNGKHILCLAPSAELVLQNIEKYKLTGNKASIFSASAGGRDLRHPVVHGTPLTVKNRISRFGSHFAMVVIDECFTGDTIISTPKGNKQIKSLRNGDIVSNVMGSGVIKSTFVKSVSEIYQVRLSNGKEIRCTGSHPFFTNDGWKRASELVNGEVLFGQENMSCLLNFIRSETVCTQGKEKSLPSEGIGLDQSDYLFSILFKEMEKSYALSLFTGENVQYIKNDGAQAINPQGEWKRGNKTPSSTVGNLRTRMGSRAPNKDESRTQERRLPKLLQSRFSQSRTNDSGRSGWKQPFYNCPERTGYKERPFFGSIRVESVTCIKLGSPTLVYNLHVSGHPSYFANGVLVHNCHGLTPTVKSIIEAMREANPNLRVVGLSATCYRMGSGYIFAQWPDGKPVAEHETNDPYFAACVYDIPARLLIEQGYMTKPVVGSTMADGYETLTMELNSRGQFDAADIDRAYHGHGRKTSAIIADVVAQSQDRQGVMIFAATVRHAHECMASLPPGLSAIVTGESTKTDRADILDRFKAREIKYLVNVSVLTTGFDAPHVDVIAILRATESVGLLQQIIGRGLRVADSKDDCLVLDYAENIERHCPDGDVFAPNVRAKKANTDGGFIECECAQCGVQNQFSARKNDEGFGIDKNGYFTDLDGVPVATEWGAMPAHYGRRCQAKTIVAGDLVQCTYRWTSKDCPHCEEPNDIAARYCHECKGEIVDPNEKLKIEFRQMKHDPTRRQTDKVIDWKIYPTMTRSGKEADRVHVTTPYRSFSFWVMRVPENNYAMKDRGRLDGLGGLKPETITYQKSVDSGFYRVHGYNARADEIPE